MFQVLFYLFSLNNSVPVRQSWSWRWSRLFYPAPAKKGGSGSDSTTMHLANKLIDKNFLPETNSSLLASMIDFRVRSVDFRAGLPTTQNIILHFIRYMPRGTALTG